MLFLVFSEHMLKGFLFGGSGLGAPRIFFPRCHTTHLESSNPDSVLCAPMLREGMMAIRGNAFMALGLSASTKASYTAAVSAHASRLVSTAAVEAAHLTMFITKSCRSTATVMLNQ